jgi:hypothetical protein
MPILDEDQQLKLASSRAKSYKKNAAHIADVIDSIMAQKKPVQKNYNSITSVLNEMLPGYILKHCTAFETRKNTLTIKLDSPSCLYQLQLQRQQLLETITKARPSAKITNIKLKLSAGRRNRPD